MLLKLFICLIWLCMQNIYSFKQIMFNNKTRSVLSKPKLCVNRPNMSVTIKSIIQKSMVNPAYQSTFVMRWGYCYIHWNQINQLKTKLQSSYSSSTNKRMNYEAPNIVCLTLIFNRIRKYEQLRPNHHNYLWHNFQITIIARPNNSE